MDDIRFKKVEKKNLTPEPSPKKETRLSMIRVGVLFVTFVFIFYIFYGTFSSFVPSVKKVFADSDVSTSTSKSSIPATLDIKDYDERMLYLAHKLILSSATGTPFVLIPNPDLATSTATTTTKNATTTKKLPKPKSRHINTSVWLGWDNSMWPAKNAAHPNPGAILPFKRIVAFYGNLYSKKMGVLGEHDETTVLNKLKEKVAEWEAADPYTPVVPALHYIAVVAQGSAQSDGTYRARMPDSEIEKVLKMAESMNALVFLDVQVGKSTLQKELPLLKKYLELSNVHLGIDPEFSMKFGDKPGSVIGTFDASDINFAADFLAGIVKEKKLPPKVLTFYRFTQRMVTHSENIKTLPEVQMVHVMDGWGGEAHKIQTYKSFVYPEPIQFTGFKLFFKNDFRNPGTKILTPAQVLKVTPSPSYIQYQ